MEDKIRTPNGEYKNPDDAMKDWYELAKPLEDLGFKVQGFDPGISFKSQLSFGRNSVFSISVDDLKIINNAILKP